MPNFKRIGGGPWKNGQKSDDLTWNDPSVTNMLQQLNWESLCQRRAKMRLTMFYKSQHALVALPLPNVVRLPIRPRPRYPCFPGTLLLNRCLRSQLLPPHSYPVEQPPSIYSNSTISWPVQGRAGTTVRLITSSLCTVYTPPTQTSPNLPHPTYHPTLHP